MKQQTESRRKKIPVIISVIAVIPVALIILFYMLSSQRQSNIDDAYNLLEVKTTEMQYSIESRLLNTEILKTMVINGDGEAPYFDKTARRLYADDNALRSLQLAPNGIVSQVYPLSRNEEGFINLFDDPNRKTEAEWARDTGNMTLAGPYELIQGGMGIVARNPIYLSDAKGKENFWGFSIVILNVPEIFDTTELDSLTKQGYYYRIWRHIPDSNEMQTIYTNTTESFDDSIRMNIELPNTTWYMSVYPESGWISTYSAVLCTLITLAIAALLIALISLSIMLVNQRRRLMHQINTDLLTGVYSIRFFTDKITTLVEEKKPFVLIYVDVNNLKQINNQYGHGEGDNVLMEVAFRIKQCISETDFLSRLRGDEFAILIPGDKTEEFCTEKKQSLINNVCLPYELFDNTFSPDISVGYARYPFDSLSVDKIMCLADTRMYRNRNKK